MAPIADFILAVIFLLLAGSIVLGLITWKWISTRPSNTITPHEAGCLWGLGDVVAVFVLGAWITVVLLAPDMATSGHWKDGKLFLPPGALARMVLVQNLVLALTCFLWLWLRYRVGMESLRIIDHQWKRRCIVGLKAGIAIWLLAEIAVRITHAATLFLFGPEMLQLLRSMESSTTLLKHSLSAISAGGVIVFIVIVGVVAPFVEEALFRGFTYPAMRARWGRRWGILLSSAFFAAAHLTVLDFPALCLVGIMLAWLYEETGSLVAPFTAHAINNVLTVVTLAWFGKT